MTGQLQELMAERADRLPAPEFDVTQLVAAGDRLVRRRRALAGGLAAVAVLVGGLAYLGLHDASGSGDLRGRDLPVAEPSPAERVAYVAGSVLHRNGVQIDLGRSVSGFVVTPSGVVFADAEQQVWRRADGDPVLVGDLTTDFGGDPRLVTDETGQIVAWLEGNRDSSRLAVLDDSTGETTRIDLAAPRDLDTLSVRAVGNGWVYFTDGRGLVGYDPSTGASEVLGPNSSGETLSDAGGGKLLHAVSDDEGMLSGITVSTRIDELGVTVDNVWDGDLSPSGSHWFTNDVDRFAVFDSATGARQDPTHPGFAFAAPYQWLDDDTIAAVAQRRYSDRAPISLLVCSVSTNTCQVAVKDAGTLGDFAIPVGQRLD